MANAEHMPMGQSWQTRQGGLRGKLEQAVERVGTVPAMSRLSGTRHTPNSTNKRSLLQGHRLLPVEVISGENNIALGDQV